MNQDQLNPLLDAKIAQISSLADDVASLIPQADHLAGVLQQVVVKLVEAKLWTINARSMAPAPAPEVPATPAVETQSATAAPELPTAQDAEPMVEAPVSTAEPEQPQGAV